MCFEREAMRNGSMESGVRKGWKGANLKRSISGRGVVILCGKVGISTYLRHIFLRTVAHTPIWRAASAIGR